ncbi:8483_t:CDS:1, partial [Entrophospora sp. SA101]
MEPSNIGDSDYNMKAVGNSYLLIRLIRIFVVLRDTTCLHLRRTSRHDVLAFASYLEERL